MSLNSLRFSAQVILIVLNYNLVLSQSSSDTARIQGNIEEKSKKIENQNETILKLSVEVAKYTTEITYLNRIVDEKIIENKSLNEKISDLENGSNINREQINELKSRISENNVTIENNQEKVRNLNTQISKQNEEIESYKDNINKLKNEIENLKNTLFEQGKTILRREIEAEYLNKSVDQKDKKILDLENQIKDKRVAIRWITGIAIYNFRTPTYALVPQDPQNLSTYVISNTAAGNWEFDWMNGFVYRIIDLKVKGKEDLNQRSSIGVMLAFGARNVPKNIYLGADFKLSAFHVAVGVNLQEFKVLETGFSIGDMLPLGTSIPTKNEFKATAFFSIAFDTKEIIDFIAKNR